MAAESLVLLLLLLPLCVMYGMCAAPGLSRVGQRAASDSTMSTAETFTLLLLLLLLLLQGVGGPWPQQGGATGSIRLNPEIRHGANAGQCCSNRQRTVGSLCTLLPLHLNTLKPALLLLPLLRPKSQTYNPESISMFSKPSV